MEYVYVSLFLYICFCISVFCMFLSVFLFSQSLSVCLSVCQYRDLLDKREAGGNNDRSVNLTIQWGSHHLQKPGLFSLFFISISTHFDLIIYYFDLISYYFDLISYYFDLISYYWGLWSHFTKCHLTCLLCLSGSWHSLQERISLQFVVKSLLNRSK